MAQRNQGKKAANEAKILPLRAGWEHVALTKSKFAIDIWGLYLQCSCPTLCETTNQPMWMTSTQFCLAASDDHACWFVRVDKGWPLCVRSIETVRCLKIHEMLCQSFAACGDGRGGRRGIKRGNRRGPCNGPVGTTFFIRKINVSMAAVLRSMFLAVPENWKWERDPHPQDFSLTKKTTRFTKGQFRPY